MKKKLQWISAANYHERLTPQLWLLVMAAYTVAIAPLTILTAQPLGAVLGAALAVKWIAWRRQAPQLALWSIALFFPLGLALAAMNFTRLGFTFSFTAMLAVMGACKMLESRNLRDTRILFLLSLCMMLVFLMYSQSMWAFVYLLFAIILNFYALMRVAERDSKVSAMSGWGAVVKLALFALPIAVLLFFTFPRIQPLWGLPRETSGAVTGLSNEMRLGDIGHLAQSNEISFRVQFEGAVPAGNKLYWRGPVLWQFTGRQWLPRSRRGQRPEALRYASSGVINYTLIPAKPDMEWVTALDMPLRLPEGLHADDSRQIPMPSSQRGDRRYAFASASSYRLQSGRLPMRDRADALQLPSGLAIPKTQALAQRLYAQGGGTASGFADAFMAYIRSNEYYYTLEPPPGAGDVDTFLFETRMGFCEHYANAFAVAARSVGIPARIVIGYQGGSLNPMTGEWVVREEDAHAWTELWLPDQGWTRYDPTAAVAPYRIQQARLSADVLNGGDTRSWGSRMADKYSAAAWMRNAADAMQTFWRNWVVGYDGSRQNSLLGSLGLDGLGRGGLLGIGLCICLLLALLFWRRQAKRPREDEDALAKALRRLIAQGERCGMPRKPAESAPAYLRRLAAEAGISRPQAWEAAAQAVENARYRGGGLASAIEAVQALRLKRRKNLLT